MAAGSPIELDAVRQALEAAQLLTAEQRDDLQAAFDRANNLGMAIKVNERAISARDVYFAYGDGHLFKDDPAAKQLLDEMSLGPMRDLVPFLFHQICVQHVGLVQLVAEKIKAAERANPSLLRPRDGAGRCIYCLTSEGSFLAEEHVVPEAFGQDEMVLTDAVCDGCNNRLSTLDQALAEFEPLEMLRVWYVPLTKKGRFPRARFREVDIEKTRPRAITVRHKNRTRRDPLAVEPQPDGSVKFSLKWTSRRRFDHIKLGRALFKVGLGLVAAQAGRDVACDPRFDRARAFINGERADMSGLLWMATNVRPEAQIQTWWQQLDDEHTVMAINLFGLWFAFDLQGGPLAVEPGNIPGVALFPLTTA